MTSKVYNYNGVISDLDDNHHNRFFFRKISSSKTERVIFNILDEHPHPNIVNVYNITDSHIDMELLTPCKMISANKIRLYKQMNSVRKHLQSLGIIYIDWKYDNIGIDNKGNYKLFDFDISGLLSNNDNWIIKPLEYFSYDRAIKRGFINPRDIDNYSFFIDIMK
jgi:serine/threonine protein kinase